MTGRDAVGAKLRAIRVQRQMKQKELAEAAGVRQDSLSRIENQHEQPGDLLAHRLAQALGCTIEDFSVEKQPRPVAAA